MSILNSTVTDLVRMNDFLAEPLELRHHMLEAVSTVLASGNYVLGEEVEVFEKEWAKHCETSFCVGVGNGMDAIEIGLRALKIGSGDEVITTPITAFATILAILRAGAVPVFADIDPNNAMLDPDSVRRCLTLRTKAILVVHLYGQSAPLDSFLGIAHDRGIPLIEDCAQAHGARFRGRPVGSFGSFGAWSFYPTKNLGAIGDAGSIVTSSDTIAEQARMIRHYGQTEPHLHGILGLNSRLDEVQAALLRARLPYLSRWTVRRREIASKYHLGIRNPKVRSLPLPDDASAHVYHLFVVKCSERDAFRRHLKSNGIESLIHYPTASHDQVPCRSTPRDPRGLAYAEQHARECVSLPCQPSLTEEDIERVIQAVNSFE
jgi:dTDP-4-amino-4,6-dideoxygalactose transaminase